MSDQKGLVDWNWKRIQSIEDDDGRAVEQGKHAFVAAYYGNVDALALLVRALHSRGETKCWTALKDLTHCPAADNRNADAARPWFHKNKKLLVFDRSKRKYFVHDRVAKGEGPDK